MKVSIIIPVYNQLFRLKTVLNAFNFQDFDDEYEVIVVDDCSSTPVQDNIKDLKINYDLIVHRLEQNSGRSVARNEGVNKSRGDILIFCDADRIPDKAFIAEHVKIHRANQGDIVVLGRIVEIFLKDFDDNYNEYIKSDNISYIYKTARDFNYFDYIEEIYDKKGFTDVEIAWVSLFTSNFSIGRSLFIKSKGFDEDFSKWGFENFEFGYRLSKMKVKYLLNRSAINFHIFHLADRTGDRRNESFELFKKKHKTQEVEQLIDFLDGKLSWQKLNAIALGNDAMTIKDESFFRPKALGKRFVFEE